jgi:hypothetical protein
MRAATIERLFVLQGAAQRRATFGADRELAQIVADVISTLVAEATVASREPPGAYPWIGLAVGDEFVLPGAVDPAVKRRALTNVSSAGIAWAKRNAPGRKFSVRTCEDGIRVRRVA